MTTTIIQIWTCFSSVACALFSKHKKKLDKPVVKHHSEYLAQSSKVFLALNGFWEKTILRRMVVSFSVSV